MQRHGVPGILVVPGDENQVDGRILQAQRLRKLHAAQPPHLDVQKGNVHRVVPHVSHRLLRLGKGHDLGVRPDAFDGAHQQFKSQRLIIHRDNAQRGVVSGGSIRQIHLNTSR